jgi:hypothetical protein
MFSFKKKKADVLNHWIAFADNFQTSALDFYAGVENELKTRQVPGLDMARVEFAEGGLVSDQRTYLRMIRERLVFDVCAAPFGTSFFFSCRMAEIPSQIKLWQLLFVLFFLGIVHWALRRWLGAWSAATLEAGALILFVCLMRNAVAVGLKDLDAMLIKSPLIGSIYEAWIRKESYYRQDTRLMYIETVPTVVRRYAEEVTSAKGVKLVRQYELAPVLGELYKPVLPRVGLETKPA